MYIQVNFGRNIDSTPMGALKWEAFTNSVIDAIAEHTPLTGDDVEIHTGSGDWAGGSEESRHVSGWTDAVTADGFKGSTAYDNLKAKLSTLRNFYEQDAIALIVTDSELI